jgi:hypothetical protein
MGWIIGWGGIQTLSQLLFFGLKVLLSGRCGIARSTHPATPATTGNPSFEHEDEVAVDSHGSCEAHHHLKQKAAMGKL